MTEYVIRRLLLLVPVVLGILTVVFVLVRIVPGDPVRLMVGFEVDQEIVEQMRHELGLDRPILVQYVDYLVQIARGDFGVSFRSGKPVLDEVLRHFRNTLSLAVAAVLLTTVAGVFLGTVAAYYHRRAFDVGLMAAASLGVSMPSYYLGILLILLFAVTLRVLPGGSIGTPAHLVLPALTLAASSTAMTARMTRSSLVEVMRQDFVRTAVAKGLSRRTAVYRHALRNALIPTMTVLGLEFGFMLGGSVLVESVFSYPGIGWMLVAAILARDFPMVQGGVVVVACTYVIINLLIDLSYAVLDPRIRY